MDIIIKVIQTQWIYIVLSILIIGAVFYIKKEKPDIYKKFCVLTLAVTSIVTVVLALFFHQPDLFLLIPIFIICCEVFNYELCCKLACLFAIDYIGICLINFGFQKQTINLFFNNVLFYALQIIIVFGLVYIIDNYLKKLKKAKDDYIEEKKNEELKANSEINNHVDSIFENLSNKDEFISNKMNSDFFENYEVNDTIKNEVKDEL